jgi:hypothetical protein
MAIPTVLSAQGGAGEGQITGWVADPSGARIEQATVTVEGQGGAAREVQTNSTGSFSVSLPVGRFAVTIASPGFRAYQATVEVPTAGAVVHLYATLAIETRAEEITVPVEAAASTASADNASALIFKGSDLDTFSSDDATFQREVEALAGGTGPRPPQIFIDGFTGGQFPPKISIREIRINKNPYSAEFDTIGFGRFEVLTKPGTDRLHGRLSVNSTDNAFNTQNPFIAGLAPPYYLLNLDGDLNGPIDRKTSFFLAGNVNDQQNNAGVNAVTLNASLPPAGFAQTVRDPQLGQAYSLRVDRQMSAGNTLTGRYEFSEVALTNGGLSVPLTLPSQAYDSGITTQTLQLSDTQVIGSRSIAETRFQYVRTRQQQGPVSSAATVQVEGGFNGGGSAAQQAMDHQDRYEFQTYFSRQTGAHFLRMGGRYRVFREANLSTQNYNGQYTFPSLTAYQVTLQGLAGNQTPSQIRAAGGGASQFSLTAGQTGATLLTGDLGVYFDDEWRVRPSVTLDAGMRFESQTDIPDHSDPAPRLGAAWALHRKGQKATYLLLRAGAGLFYDRFPAADVLTATRQNGLSQQTYTVVNPDTYPAIPSLASLSATPPSIYRISPNLRSQYAVISSFAAEKFLGKGGRFGQIGATYFVIRGDHQWGSVNINAPLPGSYTASNPASGVRPLGGSQNLFEFHSEGIQKTRLVIVDSRLNFGRRVSAYLSYVVNHTDQDVTNPTTFASNSYELLQDYGRAAQPTQQLYVGGTVQLPLGINMNLFASTQGGVPFNITTGTDLNGDTIYNDRPAFATAPTAQSVLYKTAFGSFDANPQPGEPIIPINYGHSPNFGFMEVSANRSVKLGPRRSAAVAGKDAAGKDAAGERRCTLTFSVDAVNALNHTNGGIPVGVLSSPYFGRSVSQNALFTLNTAANRAIFLQTTFSF